MTQKQAQIEAKQRWGDSAFALCVAVNAGRDPALQRRFGVSCCMYVVGAFVGGMRIPFGVGDGWKAALKGSEFYQPGNEKKFADMRQAFDALNQLSTE